MAPDSPLRTAADDLVDIVRRQKKLSIEDLAKRLKMPIGSVQAIVDFLVEEKVLGIEYNFTTPYAYINEERQNLLTHREPTITGKEEFFTKNKTQGIPQERIASLWASYLKQNLPNLKREFFSKAQRRGASAEKSEELWQKYQRYL